jgi:hypothetical protein
VLTSDVEEGGGAARNEGGARGRRGQRAQCAYVVDGGVIRRELRCDCTASSMYSFERGGVRRHLLVQHPPLQCARKSANARP